MSETGFRILQMLFYTSGIIFHVTFIAECIVEILDERKGE